MQRMAMELHFAIQEHMKSTVLLPLPAYSDCNEPLKIYSIATSLICLGDLINPKTKNSDNNQATEDTR